MIHPKKTWKGHLTRRLPGVRNVVWLSKPNVFWTVLITASTPVTVYWAVEVTGALGHMAEPHCKKGTGKQVFSEVAEKSGMRAPA